METIFLINAALALVETLLPKIQSLVKTGSVTPAEQADLQARIEKLRSPDAFTGPEWEITPPAKP